MQPAFLIKTLSPLELSWKHDQKKLYVHMRRKNGVADRLMSRIPKIIIIVHKLELAILDVIKSIPF